MQYLRSLCKARVLYMYYTQTAKYIPIITLLDRKIDRQKDKKIDG